VLKKSASWLFWVARDDGLAGACLLSGRHWGGQRDQLCQLSEVLSGGSQQELVLSTKWTSQPEPIEAQDALEMREQMPPRGAAGRRVAASSANDWVILHAR
jgi:hypothetical protein